MNKIPYRIDLAGGWLDQPFVSKYYPGPVITFPIRPDYNFNKRCGMATSTRDKAIELWNDYIPKGDPVKLAKILFCCENPPGKKEVAGSQDSIGIVVPGISRSHYNGEYWPTEIETIDDEEIINFLEDHISLVPLNPRNESYQVLKETKISPEGAQALAEAANNVWQALQEKNQEELGKHVRQSFLSQIAMFPSMVDKDIIDFVKEIKAKHGGNILGYKLSGAGGGGYLICITKEPIPESIGIKIMREIIRD